MVSFRSRRSGLLLTLSLCGLPPPLAAAPAVAAPLDLAHWVTHLWQPVGAYGGLLTNDQTEDVVIVLHRRDAIADDPLLPVGSRALAVFSLGADGLYQRTTLLEGLLPCVQCLGTINRDPQADPFEIEIADRQLTVSWIGNADGLVWVRLMIAWDERARAFGLAADEVVRGAPLSGVSSRRTRDYRTGRAVTDGQVSAFPPGLVPLSRVRAADYR